jgi:hypothetical protein
MVFAISRKPTILEEGATMRKSQFSDSQIMALLKKAEIGVPVAKICREQWPSISLRVIRSVPHCREWVAKLCRSVCGVACVHKPASFDSFLNIESKALVESERVYVQSGKR